MANLIATNFGEFTNSSEFFENLGTGLTDNFNSGEYSGSPFSFSNGNGRSFRLTNNTPIVTKTITGISELYTHIRFAVTFQNNQQDVIMRFDEGTSNHISIVWETNGTISALRNGTNLATGTTVFNKYTNRVLSVQIRVKIDDSVGVVQVRLDGSTTNEINFSGDTRNAGSGVIDRVGFQRGGSSTYAYTDFIINDTTGAAANSWTGAPRVVIGNANANGGSGVTWTASAGSNFQNIDDTLPGAANGDTDYNETSTANNKDYFSWPSSIFTGMTAGTIQFVKTKYIGKATDGGTHTMRSNAKSGGTTVNGTTITLGSSYNTTPYEDAYYTDPSTSAAWASFSAITSAEFGYELIS